MYHVKYGVVLFKKSTHFCDTLCLSQSYNYNDMSIIAVVVHVCICVLSIVQVCCSFFSLGFNLPIYLHMQNLKMSRIVLRYAKATAIVQVYMDKACFWMGVLLFIFLLQAWFIKINQFWGLCSIMWFLLCM